MNRHCILCGQVLPMDIVDVHPACLALQRTAQKNVERLDALELQRAVDTILAALNRRPELVGSTDKADRAELEGIDQALLPMLIVFGSQMEPESVQPTSETA